jgi:hypothetical protein
MTRITRQRGALKHDDRLDALAIAVAYWVESMGMDAKEAYEQDELGARVGRSAGQLQKRCWEMVALPPLDM